MTHDKPLVAIVGGPDVDARISFMNYLSGYYSFVAIGSSPTLKAVFAEHGYAYADYRLASGANPFYDLATLFSLRNLFRQIKPILVHTFDTKPSVLGRIAAHWVDVPVVIGTLPGLGLLYARSSLKVRAIKAIYEPLQRYACQHSDWTVFQNHEDHRYFTDLGIVDASHSSVILGSGVDTQRFDPNRFDVEATGRLRDSLGIAADAAVIIMISRLIRAKGVLEFAEAARIASQQNPTLRFVMVGPRDDQNLDCLTDDEIRTLKESVQWIGQRSDIPALLAMSNIFVFPSYYREGIPRVLLEAAAMGLPLVATDSPGCNEIVQHGKNGYLLSRVDAEHLLAAISELAKDTALCAQFGQVSRQRAKQDFDLAVIAQQIDERYKYLLKKGHKI